MLEAQAENIADALAALSDLDVEGMLKPADELACIQKEIASLEERKRRMLFAFELNELSPQEYAERISELNAQIQAAHASGRCRTGEDQGTLNCGT